MLHSRTLLGQRSTDDFWVGHLLHISSYLSLLIGNLLLSGAKLAIFLLLLFLLHGVILIDHVLHDFNLSWIQLMLIIFVFSFRGSVNQCTLVAYLIDLLH